MQRVKPKRVDLGSRQIRRERSSAFSLVTRSVLGEEWFELSDKIIRACGVWKCPWQKVIGCEDLKKRLELWLTLHMSLVVLENKELFCGSCPVFVDSSDERVDMWDSAFCYKKFIGGTNEPKHGMVISMDLSVAILQPPSTSPCPTHPAGALVIRTGHRQFSLGEFPKLTGVWFWVLCFYVKFVCDKTDFQSPTVLLFRSFVCILFC